MSRAVNLTELFCFYEDILREIIQLIGANCWRLALVNSDLLKAVKAVLPKLNLRIPGMCCYYKSPAIMFGMLERISERESHLYAINCYMKKSFVCCVKTLDDRAYVNINCHVISVPCINGTHDKPVENLSAIMENARDYNVSWADKTLAILQDKNLTPRGYLNTCRIHKHAQYEGDRKQNILDDLKNHAVFPDFLGMKVIVYNYFINGEKLVYDTSIGAIVKYYYEIKSDKFPVLSF